MLIIPANSASAAGGFDVANSCRFEFPSTSYMTKSSSSVANQQKFTISVWVKRSNNLTYSFSGFNNDMQIIGQTTSGHCRLMFNSTGTLQFYGPTRLNIKTNRLFRDFSAWYHIFIAVDTTQGTAANRVKMFINGVQETSLATATYPNQNDNLSFFVNSQNLVIGKSESVGGYDYLNAYLSEFVCLEGTTAAPTDFGEFDGDSGIWKPIEHAQSGNKGANGFYLDFKDSSNLGNDAYGGTDFTESNITATDQSTDTCTNNFATIGILFTPLLPPIYSEGNLQSYSTAAGFYPIPSSIGVANGKWYMELKYTATTSNDNTGIGITMDPASGNQTNTDQGGYVFGYSAPDGNLFPYQGEPSGSFASYTVGDIMGIYMDLDNMKLYFSKNGALQSATGKTINVSNTGFYYFCVLDYTNTSNYWTWQWNFGGGCPFAISSGNTDANDYGNFEYSPTITGDGASKDFLALCTKNLAESG